MRKFIVALLTIFYLNSVQSQTPEAAGAAVAGAIIAGLATAIAVDNVIDQLEWRATEYVLLLVQRLQSLF